MAKREKSNVPNPSSEQVEYYLRAWDELENYYLQEDAWISSSLRFVQRIQICPTFF